MPDLWMDVDIAVTVPCNIMPLIATSDFKTVADNTIAYNETGLEIYWNFVTTAGVMTTTAFTPTTASNHDWTHVDGGMYKIEIPATGGTVNNDTEGFGWISGLCPGGTPEVCPFRGPTIGFRAAGLNDLLVDTAYSATRGLAGTALPAAAADAAGGLVISDAGGLDIDALALWLKGATSGKKVIDAAGTQVEIYNSAGTKVCTLDRTGTGPYTWTPTWA